MENYKVWNQTVTKNSFDVKFVSNVAFSRMKFATLVSTDKISFIAITSTQTNTNVMTLQKIRSKLAVEIKMANSFWEKATFN